MQLNNMDLFRQQSYINGQWISGVSGHVLAVTDPATSNIVGRVPCLGAQEAAYAIESANAAWPAWAAKTAKERAFILRNWFNLIMANHEDLAKLMTIEQGKPLAESRNEITYAAHFIEWFAEEGKRIYGDVIPSHLSDKRIIVLKQSIGVVAAMTPWNFPSSMITRKCGPALAAGCPIVIKPASEAPFSALALAVLAEQAGLPAGVFNVITGDAIAIGHEMMRHPMVRQVSFAGSTKIGKILMRQGAETVKKMVLELEGNAPFIVFDDADIDAAVDGAIASKFRNSGQTCICANRFYVQAAVYDEFIDKFVNKVSELKVGNGLEEGVTLGPLINQAAINKVKEHIADAVAKGGQILMGGAHSHLGGQYLSPTVISGATAEMLLAREETFGPLAPIFKFETEAQAITMANETDFGLAAYFYSRDLSRVWRVAEAIESGMVGVNTGLISTEVAPFGGIKESGIGREGSKYGIEAFIEIKYVCLDIS